MKIIAVIPARMGSSRFPGKPMKKIHGIPMIGHCYFRTQMCSDLLQTYVARKFLIISFQLVEML